MKQCRSSRGEARWACACLTWPRRNRRDGLACPVRLFIMTTDIIGVGRRRDGCTRREPAVPGGLDGGFLRGRRCARYRDLGLSVFEGHDHIECRSFADHRAVIEPDQIGDAQGVIVLTPRVTAESVARSDELLAIGRFGVGYDGVDVAACTAADVAVFITVGATDRSVAEAALGVDAGAVAAGPRQGCTGPLGGVGRAVAI